MTATDQTLRLAGIPIQLSEASGAPEKIQLIRCGTFTAPKYGTFKVTPDMLKNFVKNFDSNVRQVDLAIDYAHNSHLEAAAWMKSLELSEDGQTLFANVKWTTEGEKKVAGLDYRYISADFNPNYQDNESLKFFGPTLLGAALTNRPVIKGQQPVIELNETKGNEVDPKDQRIAELEKENAALKASAAKPAAAGGGGTDPADDGAGAADDTKNAVELAAMKAQNDKLEKQLSESRAETKAFRDAEQKRADEAALNEKKKSFDVKLSEGSVVEAQRAPFMSGDMDAFLKAAMPIKLGATGGGASGEGDGGAKSAVDQVLELAEKKVAAKEAKTSGDAISIVLSENPELAKQYNEQK